MLTYYPDLAVVVHYGFGVHDLIRVNGCHRALGRASLCEPREEQLPRRVSLLGVVRLHVSHGHVVVKGAWRELEGLVTKALLGYRVGGWDEILACSQTPWLIIAC